MMIRQSKIIFFAIVIFLCCAHYVTATISIPYSTTFNCSEWSQGQTMNCDGLGPWGSWTAQGQGAQITSAANNPSGGGGRGYRNWYCDGKNCNSGSIRAAFSTGQTEFWIRWYMRYQSGFKWNYLQQHKNIYLDMGVSGQSNPGFQGDTVWGFPSYVCSGCLQFEIATNAGWLQVYPTGTSDGTWHCYEIHMRKETVGNHDGLAELWIDGTLRGTLTGLYWGGAGVGWTSFILNDNADNVNAGGGIMYVDWDDMAISNTGYIGPLGVTPSPPSAPTGVSATPGNAQNVLYWSSVSGATSYNVYWSTSSGVTKTNGTKITGVTSPYTHTGLTNGTIYYYVVTAVNANGESAESLEFAAMPSIIAPSPPTGVTATPGDGQNTISWSSVSGATSYNLYWSITSGVNKTNGTKITGVTSPYTHTGRTAGTTYYYVVTAVNVSSESAESAQVSATPTGGTGPTILFQETFDNASFTSRGWYDVSASSSSISTTEHAPGSSSSFYCAWTSGGSNCTSGSPMRRKFTATDNVYLSFWIKHSTNWGGDATHLIHFLTNKDSDYSGLARTRLTAYVNSGTVHSYGLDLELQDAMNIDSGNINIDLTQVTENRASQGCNGFLDSTHDFASCYLLSPYYYNMRTWEMANVLTTTAGPYYMSDWHFIEAYYKLNTIGGDGKARADGLLQMWFDHTQVVNETTVTFRTNMNADMLFNQIVVVPYITSSSRAQYIWIDDLTVGVGGVTTSIQPPSSVTASALSAEQTSISWSSVSGASGYNVYWSYSPGVSKTTGVQINVGTQTTYTHTNLLPGTTYYYVVTALGTNGESAVSNEVSTTTTAWPGVTTYFRENFDNNSFSTRNWYDSPSGTISTAQHIEGSPSSFECIFNAGSTTCTGGTPKRHAITATDSIYVSYWIKHSSTWAGNGTQNYYPYIAYVLSTLDGDYDSLLYNYLAVYMEEAQGYPTLALQDGRNIDTGQIGVDLTNVSEYRSIAGCNGTQSSLAQALVKCSLEGSNYMNEMQWRGPDPLFLNSTSKQQWHKVEMYIKLNSVTGGVGQANGIVKYWLDGWLVVDQPNVIIRTNENATMQFDQVALVPYISNGASVQQTIWIDDMVVASGKSSSTSTTPSAPTNLRCGY